MPSNNLIKLIMSKKFKVILTLLFAFLFQFSFGQTKTVSGIVSDETGSLPGVSVLIKGTTIGTETDFDGNYSLEAEEGAILQYSFVGMKTQEIAIGSSNTINVTLEADENVLDEVVVTALGIKREKKALGYSTQEVKGKEIATVKSGNFTNALAGRISGMQIKKNTNFGGSTNVVIRGNASLTGSNQALFVIDGVPISNSSSNSKGQQQGSGNYYDYGNAASDINPDDIESINVLKGAAASALYGSRAANGVVIITTKKGKKSKGLGVTINAGVTIGTIDKSTFANYQKEYGAGYGPYYEGDGNHFFLEDIDGDGIKDLTSVYTEDGSYGAAFDSDLLIYQWDSFDPDSPNYLTKTAWQYAKNDPTSFFETPITTSTSISIEEGFENGTIRLGYTNFDQSGLMPNSTIDKHNFSLSGTADINDKFSVTGTANYIKTDAVGRNSTGYSDNLVGMFKQWWQTNVDLKQQKDIYFQTGRNVTWNPVSSQAGSSPIFWDNPYWNRYENYQNDSRNRFFGNVALTYKIADWVSVTARVATDTYSEIQEERRAVGSVPTNFGVLNLASNSRGTVDSGYGRKNISLTESNYDLMFNFNYDLSEELNLAGILGTNINRSEYQLIHNSTSGGLAVPQLYSLQNSNGPLLGYEQAEKKGTDGIYASASLGYKNMLYLDATIRRDHSSTLPEDNSTFYYPSVSTSFVFNRLLNVDNINFAKLRANYAEVGNSAPFDFLYDTYNVNIPPGTPSTSVPNTKKNPDLKPERTKSFEVGLEMKLLQSRLGFDVATYQTNSVDQIVSVPVTTTTGYAYKVLNAGEIENKGVELTLFGTPVKKEDFSWNATVNWSKNNNEVLSLEDGIETLQLGNLQGSVTINAEVGHPYGVIYGTDYTYLNPDTPKESERLIDPESGQYLKSSTSNNIIGDTNPDWMMGISNAFSYKDFTFSFLVDIQKGGSIFSLDQYYGLATGLYAETAFINDLGNPVRDPITGTAGNYGTDSGGFINSGANPDGSQNETRINANRFGAFGYRRGLPDKAFVYDAGFVKLREVVLSYNVPEQIIDKTFFTGASISAIGSNLWIIDKSLPHADPESGLGSGNLQGFSVGALPSTKDVAINIKLQF